MVKVLIVEDDPMARKLLEIFIKDSENYELVNSIESAAMAEFYCLTNPVDVILMDVCTAMDSNGLEAAEKIKSKFPAIKVIIITSQPECSFIDRAHAIGVDSFWYKEAEAEKILEVLDRTMAGESVYPDSTLSLKIGDAFSEDFSERELEILRELINGETDAAIASKLHLSLRTVKGYIQDMRLKTGFRNRTELAVRVRESGLVINDRKNKEE